MTSSKSTKRALLFSALAIVLCIAMLSGTTYAWFTDTASTGVNKIVAGNLDIELQMKDNDGNWVNAEGKILPFLVEGKIPAEGTQILWEPGCTYYVPQIRVFNKGNLAVKFEYIPEALGVTGKLAEVLELVLPETDGNIEPEVLKPGEASPEWSFGYHMLESAGNEYQNATATGICVTVVATQATYENDSFNNQYDKDATYPVTDNKGLKEAINNATDGSTVLITSGEYTLSDPAETSKIEIPAGATIAGAGADNTTLNVNNDKIAKDNVTLKDMTIKGSGSQGTGGTLNVNGNNTTIENIDYKGDGNIAIAVSTGGSNSGTTFRGTKITNAFRGIQFWSLSGNSVIDNCVLDVAGYTFNIDAAEAGSTLTITNSTLNGWTSYTSGIDLVTFDSCKLGLNAYSYLRPYSETKLVNCEFTSDGYQLNAGGSNAYTITLTNCTKNGTPITADNVKTLLLDMDDWNSNATLIVNGVTVSV